VIIIDFKRNKIKYLQRINIAFNIFLQILRGNKATAEFICVAALASMKQFPAGFTLRQSKQTPP